MPKKIKRKSPKVGDIPAQKWDITVPSEGEVFRMPAGEGAYDYVVRKGSQITKLDPGWWKEQLRDKSGNIQWGGKTIGNWQNKFNQQIANQLGEVPEYNISELGEWMRDFNIKQKKVGKDEFLKSAQTSASTTKESMGEKTEGPSNRKQTPIESIRNVFGENWEPAPIFKEQGLTDQGIYGAVRIAGTNEVYTLGPNGGWESPESYRQLFGTDEQPSSIVGIISPSQAKQLGIQIQEGGAPAEGAKPRTVKELPSELGGGGASGGGAGGGSGGTDGGDEDTEFAGVDTSGWNDAMVDAYKQITDMLDSMVAQGNTVNPDIEIDEVTAAQFLQQAQKEMDPYYSSMIEMAQQDLINQFQHRQSAFQRGRQQAERGYEENIEGLSQTMAGRGLAYSGRRKEAEEELAQGTREAREQARENLFYQTSGLGTAAERSIGSENLKDLQFPTVAGKPNIIAGKPGFQGGEGNVPLYELSDDVTGKLERERQVAEQQRVSELESAYRQNRALDYQT